MLLPSLIGVLFILLSSHLKQMFQLDQSNTSSKNTNYVNITDISQLDTNFSLYNMKYFQKNIMKALCQQSYIPIDKSLSVYQHSVYGVMDKSVYQHSVYGV